VSGAPLSIPLFRAAGLRRTYRLGGVAIEALRGLDLEIARGEFVVIAGPSGSGKTTLLNLLGTLDEPDAGDIWFEGARLAERSGREKTLMRRRQLGFVFQTFNLVPVLSAHENVEYPLWIDGVPAAERRRRVEEALAVVGLGSRARHRPDQLSGGERQRVSLARALVHEPLAILADEPTANLDSRTARSVVDLLAGLNAQRRTTFVFATHDAAIVERAPRTVRLADGTVASDTRRAAP